MTVKKQAATVAKTDNDANFLEEFRQADIKKVVVEDVSLVVDYWTPEDEGELKIAAFDRYGMQQFTDDDTGEEYDLEVAYFWEKKKDNSIVPFAQGSVRLVSAMKNIDVRRGSMFEITFLGKKKNKTNSNSSDRWDIKPVSFTTK